MLVVDDRALKGVFAAQADIAGSIAQALGVEVLSLERQRIEQTLTANTEAYCYYLEATEFLSQIGQTGRDWAALELAEKMLLKALKGLSPEQQEMSLERVPEHRAIVSAWKSPQPQQATFLLPSASAPTGRPLHKDEIIEVIWTIAAPEDNSISGKADRRRHRLLRLLREATAQFAAPPIAALSTALDVSERTIKRDLAALRAAGHPVSTRGTHAKPAEETNKN